jgi:hypothetical protein
VSTPLGFEQLVVEAQRRLSGDPNGSRGLFEQALALRRGQPLAEFAAFEFARQEADRLQEVEGFTAPHPSEGAT